MPFEKEEQVSPPGHQREGPNGLCFCSFPAGLCIWHLAAALYVVFITEIKEEAETLRMALVEESLEPCCFYVAGTAHRHGIFQLTCAARLAIPMMGGREVVLH